MIDAFAPDGVLLYQNNGTGSGQEAPHAPSTRITWW